MRVRTDVGALVAGAVLAAFLTLITVGDGSPPKARGEAAEITGLQPMKPDPRLPQFQREGEPPRTAVEAPAPATPEPQSSPFHFGGGSLDRHVLQMLIGAALYVGLFFAGHQALRRGRVDARWGYAGLGAAAALIAISLQAPPGGWALLIREGRLSQFFAVVLIAGAIMGFVYRWRAGLEAEGDDPAALEAALAAGPSGEGVHEGGALIDTGTEAYFDGPVQVRTALPVAFVASLMSCGAYSLAGMAVGFTWELGERMNPASPPMPLDQASGLALQSQLHWIMMVYAAIPITIVVIAAHHVLRAMGKTSYRAYGTAGAAASLVLVLLTGFMGVFLALQAVIPLALSMCVYRNMAGLEPRAVKEDILVRDRRNLVGEGHARRRYGRLVKG